MKGKERKDTFAETTFSFDCLYQLSGTSGSNPFSAAKFMKKSLLCPISCSKSRITTNK